LELESRRSVSADSFDQTLESVHRKDEEAAQKKEWSDGEIKRTAFARHSGASVCLHIAF
jgi:hypothetical protein